MVGGNKMTIGLKRQHNSATRGSNAMRGGNARSVMKGHDTSI